MTQITAKPQTLVQSLEQFLRELDKSPLTIRAYRSDMQQFLRWTQENDVTITSPGHVTRSHIAEYLKSLDAKGQTGTTRARKLISLQVFFSFL